MSPGDWALAMAALIGSLSGVAALVKAIHDRRAGVSADERQARRDQLEDRRDTLGERDAFIDRLSARLERVENRLAAAEDGNVAKALVIRAQGDHIDALEHHIWRQLPPPPPPRPSGV